jgi:beta-N-acetylhexosaminidase
MRVGELFILGFFGKVVPAWLREFAGRYGLGGVILFDYSCQTRQYDNNIDVPEQVRRLCGEISALPSQPMVFIDQEGGLVRRLKEGRGFRPLPSAKEFNALPPADRLAQSDKAWTPFRPMPLIAPFFPRSSRDRVNQD